MLGDMSVGENSGNEGFKQVEVERDCLLEEMSVYKMVKGNRENILLEKEVVAEERLYIFS